MNRPAWALRLIGSDPPLYWSSTLGWARAGEAPDTFTSDERRYAKFIDPAIGQWVCASCGQGDPESPGHVCR